MKIDEKFYAAGIAAYKDGATLREVLETVTRLEDGELPNESKSYSFALGFAECVLTSIRKATAN